MPHPSCYCGAFRRSRDAFRVLREPRVMTLGIALTVIWIVIALGCGYAMARLEERR